ncbi:MAG: carboxypeptidase regulatory-like domain-containing protein [Gemmatimonas sp.]|jgi:hypothetical protein|uniref:carboxypeptidase-like regulatory domain-containing protein n=1 Tax=Gemmatimonas sp. TaxID=1962908 RepID=UPI00391F2163|nr:TonB-dependent receptor [Gemmatimonadota bacterium]
MSPLPHFSGSPRSVRLSLCAGAVLSMALALLSTTVSAQARTTVRDRAQQERARDAVRDADRFSVIDGTVTDTLMQPLGSADVSVVGTGARVVTSENGRFLMLQVPPGQYLVVVRRIGFAPTSGIIEVPERDTLRLSYTLVRSSNLMDTVRVRSSRVTMRMFDFEKRRQQGLGQFITQDEIERRGSVQTSDFLRYMRGVQVSQNTTQAFGGTQVYSRREGGGFDGNQQQQYCPMQVLLDGIILPRYFNLDLLPPPKQIAGIEVYSGAATIPPQFGGVDRRCGVVAVWTRDGY